MGDVPVHRAVSELHPARAMDPSTFRAALTPRVARVLRAPDFDIDLLDRCVRYQDGEEVRFTPHQWCLLERLVRVAPDAVGRESLNTAVFGIAAPADETAHLDVLIRQVRRKLEPEPGVPRYLVSIDADTYAYSPGGHGWPVPGRWHPVEPPADIR